ncbi:hypothetical protein [Sulfuriferula nivalis]|jgi:hypothetical protein|uniref:DUF86 domain-containing protein n=1 Tax=Sulfuriferula nivalis TaxID=2675298 RepID=A0A809RLP5_9PROT|nr:hypothetical protein [Sulfuriferula nivalis]BBP02345.1 hypothetical protein SFSGTM_30530 [Sulfuriferula nivalis]
MTSAKIELLQIELQGLQLAAEHLRYSLARCEGLTGITNLPPEQLERLESLASRFARLADLLTQRLFRLIDDIELVGNSTLLDRIYRAEKRGWGNASELIKIRELRNLIAHEYSGDRMVEVYTAVASLTPSLLNVVPAVTTYANSLIQHY